MLEEGKTTEPTGTSMSAPQEPSLQIHSIILERRLSEQWIIGNGPYNQHVSADALPHFTDEEIHVRTPHADADNRERDTPKPAGNGQESSLGGEDERLRFGIKFRRDCVRSRGRANCDLKGLQNAFG